MNNQLSLMSGMAKETINRTPIEVALDVDENGMTTAKKLYKFLELAPQNFSRWCKSNIIENEFAEENVDFFRLLINEETPTGGKIQREDYKLTAKFAKKLSSTQKNYKGELAREYLASLDDGVKQIANEINNFPPELKLMIKMQIEQNKQEKELLEMKQEIKELNAKVITRNENYYTIAGYASLRGINIDINKANMLGRRASTLSKEYNYTVSKVKDTRFGHVNSYHTDILKEVFAEI